ncbi:hypothetical protein [Coralloluteibacterium stylophorae]|uniref:Uncharacterized protein n=1 Tax=Coralloluteibacterium stylophorae TaxID=1776034 RepID=A0A8J7VSY9_9GAMM|nr:hypothetical protein [Coralloluteibacterium stylophorae]MBS7456792.1 hypothetical protein [Coralloluteibacterium stylophorae]
MSLLHIIQQETSWLVFDGDRVRREFNRPKLDRAAVVVADFEGAVSAVSAFEGSAAHAVALIQKRLRADGLIDSESKILLHKTRTVGAGYQALFTAVPLERWQQTFAWAEAQPDHCLLIPATSLLWGALRTGSGVVLQSGRQVIAIAALKHDIVYRSALAYSNDPDDLAMTVGALADGFAQDLAQGDDALEALTMQWCPVLSTRPSGEMPWPDEALRELFSERSGLKVELCPTRLVHDAEGRACRSGIAWIEKAASPLIAVNPPASRAAWIAERVLPWASAASLLFAFALATLGGRWTLAANEALARADAMRQEIDTIDAGIAALRPAQQLPDEFGATLGFVERAAALEAGVDPIASLDTIREAAGDGVRILRVRVEAPTAPGARNQPRPADAVDVHTVRVDGTVDAQDGGMQVARFVERLRAAGFDPVAVDPGSSGVAARANGGFFSYLLKRAPQARADGSA